jgi:O-antigen/teichoic acid export membrane protein
MSLKKKAIVGIFWSAVQSWGKQAISLVVFGLLARLLGPEIFGQVALASIFIAFIETFLDQGFSVALIQRQDLDSEHLNSAFWSNIILGIIMTLIGISGASFMANIFNHPELTSVFRWLSLSFLLSGFSNVQAAIFQRNFNFKVLAIRSLITVIVGGVTGVLMALNGFGVWSLVGQQLIGTFFGTVILWLMSNWKPSFVFSIKHFKELSAFGVNIIGINILEFFNRRTDDFLIGFFLGSVALGYYSIAYRILLILLTLLTSVTNQVALPLFSRLQNDKEALRNAFYKATRITSFISFPVFAGVALLAPELINLFFGKQWSPSITIIQILSLIGIIESVYFFNANIFMAMDKPSWRLGLNFINCFFNVFGFLIAIRWGIQGVALSYVLRGYLLSPLPLLALKKLISLDIKDYYFQFLTPLISSVLMTLIVGFTKNTIYHQLSLNILIIFLICIISGIFIYLSSIFIFEPRVLKKSVNSAIAMLGK